MCICVQEHLEAAQHCAVAAFEAEGRTVLPMEFASEAPGMSLAFPQPLIKAIYKQLVGRNGSEDSRNNSRRDWGKHLCLPNKPSQK